MPLVGNTLPSSYWRTDVKINGQPMSALYCASHEGLDFIQQRLLKLSAPFDLISLKPFFKNGPFQASDAEIMVGDCNAGVLLQRYDIFGIEYGDKVLAAIIQRFNTRKTEADE